MKFGTYIFKFNDKPDSPVLTLNGDVIEYNAFRNIYSQINNALLHGINDIKDLEVCSEQKWYNMWNGVIKRANQKSGPYRDVDVDYTWLKASNFKAWFDENNYEVTSTDHRDAIVIDKDILIPGNRMYSPKTCLLVSSRINGFFVDSYKVTRSYTKNPDGRYYTRMSYFYTDETKHLSSRDSYELTLKWAEKKNIQLRDRVIPYFKSIVHPDYINKPMPQLVLKTLEKYDFVEIAKQNKKLSDAIFRQMDDIIASNNISIETEKDIMNVLLQVDESLLAKVVPNKEKSKYELLDIVTKIISSNILLN